MNRSQAEAVFGPDGCLATVLGGGDGLTLRVCGGCMAPDLSDGSRVRVERRPLFPGDVVAYSCPAYGRMVVHRLLGHLWRRGGWQLMTMADRGARPDALVNPSLVLGRVVTVDGAAYRVAPAQRVAAAWRFFVWSLYFAGRRLLPRFPASG